MPANPKLSVIVLNWNGKRYIDSFMKSLEKQSFPADQFELLFVDNDSSDDSVNYFKQKYGENKRYSVIQTGNNYGYSGGNNYGFKAAQGKYVVVCNNDLELAPDCLEKLVEAAERSDSDVVVPKLVFTNNHKINNAGSMLHPEADWPIIERGMDQPAETPEFNKEVGVTAFCGACPLFRRSFLEEVGLFDKRFFLYWEDGDLSWRGQKKGKKYLYVPAAVAYHHHSGSTGGEQSKTFIYYVSRNRVLILLKHARWSVVFRAFAKVGRDQVLWKIRDLFKGGGTQSVKNLWLGIRIILGIIVMSPLMLAKRWHFLAEEHL